LGLKPEELARASLADLLGLLQEDFQKAAGYVLNGSFPSTTWERVKN